MGDMDGYLEGDTSVKLRDGTDSHDRRLDLIRNPARRDLDRYNIAEVIEESTAPLEGGEVFAREGRIWQPSPHVLDQGREGACVGYAFAADLGGAPMRRMKKRALELQAQALAVYHRAQEIDPWPETGAEGGEEGTSVEAGARAAVEAGHFSEFRWAESVDALIASLTRGRSGGDVVFGPAIIGVEWRDGMYEASTGAVNISGTVVGGHAIWVRGVDLAGPEPRFFWRNSWGPSYGLDGDAWISASDLATILGPEPEICCPVGRNWPERSA